MLQTKSTQEIFSDQRAILTSETYERGPIIPVRVSARMWGGSNGQSITVQILGGNADPLNVKMADIVLTESESEESFTVYAPWRFLVAKITAVDDTKPGAVTVYFDAIE